MIAPPLWSDEELEESRKASVNNFRRERMAEPLEEYLETFDEYQGVVEELLERTVDLTRLNEAALDILTDERFLEAFRYLPGPPISTDDLKIIAAVL